MLYLYLSKTQIMKKIVGLLSSSLVACFFLITGPVAVTSCEKEIIRDTIIITDTLTIVDTVCYDLKDGLIAWYNFNGATLKDSSGNNNHINFSNAVATTDRFGKPNNAYLFNGTSSYMTVPNSTSLNPNLISIAATVKLNGFYTGPCHLNNILSKGSPDDVNGFYMMRVGTYQDCSAITDTTKEIFAAAFGNNNNPYGSAAGAGSDTLKVRTGRWYQVVYTYDGTISKMYIDGKLVSSLVKSATTSGNSQDLFIGKHNSSQFPYWFNGIIDEIRIYNKPLCEGAVKQMYKQKS